MGASSPEDPTRGYEIPIVLHGITEFDVAADLGCKDTVPVGEFTRCEHIHLLTEFDCSQPVEKGEAVALRLIFDLLAGESSPSLSPDVSELLYELHEYDKKLGGGGLDLDLSASRGGDGRLSLVLRPNEQQGAADRFRRMAEQLESPITDGLPEGPTDSTPNSLLADIASRWEKTGLQQSNGVAGTSDLMTSRDRLRGYGVQFELVHAA